MLFKCCSCVSIYISNSFRIVAPPANLYLYQSDGAHIVWSHLTSIIEDIVSLPVLQVTRGHIHVYIYINIYIYIYNIYIYIYIYVYFVVLRRDGCYGIVNYKLALGKLTFISSGLSL